MNLGHDSDTTGAVYGQLAGAHYGAEAIPFEWVERLVDAEGIIRVADALHEADWAVQGSNLRPGD